MSEKAIDGEGKKMPLLDHLIELRSRLLYCAIAVLVVFIGGFAIAEQLYNFLAQPLADALYKETADERIPRMIFTSLPEKFFTDVKIAFFFAMFLCFPFILIQFWLFVAPGLYKNERKALAPFLVATPFLFFLGGSLVYYVIFPLAWQFFLQFESPGGEGVLAIELEPKVGEYLSLVMKLIFAFGICFQLPVLMTLLARVGMVTSRGMASKRKYAIVGVFVVAAIFTPPDPLSQLSLAIPIIALYEVSIWLARMVEKQRGDDEYDYDEPEEEDTTPTPGGTVTP